MTCLIVTTDRLEAVFEVLVALSESFDAVVLTTLTLTLTLIVNEVFVH